MKEAMFYSTHENSVQCELCPHNCKIKEGNTGVCQVRLAKRKEDGKLGLFTLNYGEITSFAVDPIEKKPLYEFYPGTAILSIGSFGCNFTCSFCQNYSISQFKPSTTYISPQEMMEILKRSQKEVSNLVGIAFTYNEPSIWYEYVLDTAKLIRNTLPNVKVVLVTNGYINEAPLQQLLPYVDAMNIDLKGNQEFYRKICSGRLDNVLNTIRIANANQIHIEVTTLLVSGTNSDQITIDLLGHSLASVNSNIPLHISRYFPNYKLNNEPTSLVEMKDAYHRLKQYLNHIYIGNVNNAERDYIVSGGK